MISTKNYKPLTKDNILAEISTYDIFKHYINNFESVHKAFCSELRVDKKPSARIFKTKSGEFMYKDFAYTEHTFSAFSYVMEMYNIGFMGALDKINQDFYLALGVKPRVGTLLTKRPVLIKEEELKKIKSEITIRIVSRPYDKISLDYWLEYGIKERTLKKFMVKSIKGFYLNNSYFKCASLAYAYCFGSYKYKLLQPVNKDCKWLSNTSVDILQGWNQLDDYGDICFITSSLKDVMVLDELGYNAIAPQSELTSLNQEVIDELKRRFNQVIILYDNDVPGIDNAFKLSKSTGLDYVHIPSEYEEKDPSDFSKKHGLQELSLIINSII